MKNKTSSKKSSPSGASAFFLAGVAVLIMLAAFARNIFVSHESKQNQIESSGEAGMGIETSRQPKMEYGAADGDDTDGDPDAASGEPEGDYAIAGEMPGADPDMMPKELREALEFNPELKDFAAAYPEGTGAVPELSEDEIGQDYPLFLQWDPRWGYEPYGENCIGLAGCGPTSLSMALFYLTGDESLTPDKIAEYSMAHGYYEPGFGTAWTLMDDLPPIYGVGSSEIGADESEMKAALDGGEIIICALGKGEFTLHGHFIVIYGYDGDGFKVNDPNSVLRSNRRWQFSDLQDQFRKIWGLRAGGGAPGSPSNQLTETLPSGTMVVIGR